MTDETQKLKMTPELAAAGIAERCYSDSDFRQSFIDNPRTCIKEVYGKELPEELKIVACENSDSKWYVPVPPSGAREISEEDLAKLAGGEIVASIAIGTAVGVLTGSVIVGVGLAVWASINLSQGNYAFQY